MRLLRDCGKRAMQDSHPIAPRQFLMRPSLRRDGLAQLGVDVAAVLFDASEERRGGCAVADADLQYIAMGVGTQPRHEVLHVAGGEGGGVAGGDAWVAVEFAGFGEEFRLAFTLGLTERHR